MASNIVRSCLSGVAPYGFSTRLFNGREGHLLASSWADIVSLLFYYDSHSRADFDLTS